MNMKEFFKDCDDIEKYVNGELDEIADCFYSFAHGFWDLDAIGYPEKYLKDVVFNEYKKDGGIFKKYFDIIYKLEDKLEKIEEEARKGEDDFDPDESLVEKLRTEYQFLIRDFSKKMFLYGVKFGTRLSRKI